MHIKQLLKLTLTSVLFLTFTQIDTHADKVDTKTNDVKVTNVAKSDIPTDKAHLLSKETGSLLKKYNKAKTTQPQIVIYTAKSVPNNNYSNYLREQIKTYRANHEVNKAGEVHYLFVEKDNKQFVAIQNGSLTKDKKYKTYAQIIKEDVQPNLDKKQYDKAAIQVIANVVNHTAKIKQSGEHDNTLVFLIIIAALVVGGALFTEHVIANKK